MNRKTNSERNSNPNKRKPEKGRKKRYWIVLAWVCGLTALLNLLACVQPFCDLYKQTVYGVISDGLGMLTGWFPVALGELLMYFGALAALAGAVILILYPFLCGRGRSARFRRFAVGYGKAFLMAAAVLLFLYTLNWVIPFRSSILKVNGATTRGYTVAEVGAVRDYILNMLNASALAVERDGDGKVIYDRQQMQEAVFLSMKGLSGEYPILAGYYPPIKAALCSDFLEWMGIGGYTYPYTMEITWNEYCHDLYFPFLLAHESSHHQGYYQENEANFIAFLACISSEDPLIRYAGYNEIYYYINRAYYSTLVDIFGVEGAKAEWAKHPRVSDLVLKDRRDAQEASQEKYEADSHPAQKLSETASQVADVGWTVQGDILQENSYDGVVKMVLEYFFAFFLEQGVIY